MSRLFQIQYINPETKKLVAPIVEAENVAAAMKQLDLPDELTSVVELNPENRRPYYATHFNDCLANRLVVPLGFLEDAVLIDEVMATFLTFLADIGVVVSDEAKEMFNVRWVELKPVDKTSYINEQGIDEWEIPF